ncbi:MAG TPA: iron chelate uptake ABC transporter family permease subunit, partial [Acholeplasma sp.]|nr:iron chelate uptake ABC transporter family permease subunit [Acholeplasma sp.]
IRKNKNNIVLLLLLGLVITSLASSITNFIQVFMNPDEFQQVVSLTTVNINAINSNLVLISIPIFIIMLILFSLEHKYYDVIALGEDHAINLGVNYNKKSNLSILYITISMAVATALVGPLSFLGLIVVNSAKELFKTNKHKTLMITSSLIAITIILGGQVILELLAIKTPVTVVVNLIGGLYLIYILVKENIK